VIFPRREIDLQVEIDERVKKLGTYVTSAAVKPEGPGMPARVKAELPCLIYLNGRLTADMGCTPTDMDKLAVGRLISLGLVRCTDIIRVDVKILESTMPARDYKLLEGMPFAQVDVTSVKRRLIPQKPKDRDRNGFKEESLLGIETGKYHPTPDGLFACGVYRKGNATLYEDIYLVNAFFKSAGVALCQDPDLKDTVAVIGGTITGEMAVHAQKCGFLTMCSPYAPTSAALRAARGKSLSIYGMFEGRLFKFC
jgi:formate dehydrogenase assembly factor FdhD